MEHGQRAVPLTSSNLVYERKFDIALRSTHGIQALNLLKERDVNTIDRHILCMHVDHYEINLDEVRINTNVYPLILEMIVNKPVYRNKLDIQRMSHIIERCLNIQEKALYSSNQPRIRPQLEQYATMTMGEIKSSDTINSCLSAFHDLTDLVDTLPKTDGKRINKDSDDDDIIELAKQCRHIWTSLGITFAWSRHSCLIKLSSTWYLMPRTIILMFHNKISDLLSVLVLAAATPDSAYGTPCLDVTVRFIKELMRLAIIHDQSFFDISKVLEAIVIGETLRKSEGHGNTRFLATVVDSLAEKGLLEYDGCKLQEILRECSLAMMHELSCLSKLMGHPFCDMAKTADDMYVKTHEVRNINLDRVQESVRLAKQDYVRIYILKNGKWPEVDIDAGASEVIQTAHRLGIDPNRKSHQQRNGLLRLEHWDAVELRKEERFDKLENFIPYVKDRTVSLLRSEVLEKYWRHEDYKPSRESWIETRALLAYLLLPYEKTEHISYLEIYAHEEWEQMLNLLITRLVPKEKEHKVSARCFGCKPAKERARTIVLGHNAARFLHKYSDSEAMTLSELTLTKKLAAFRNMHRAYKNFEQIIICLDASGWNSRLRNAALAPIAASVLDPVFGENMFGQFHESYHHMFFYLPDAGEVHSWDGQSGGVEGQDQYIWVHSYISHLKTVMSRFGLPYQLLVKGDDARVVILVPPQHLQGRTIEEIRAQLVAEITEGAGEFGYQMKPEDCYGSQIYCAFSKNAFIRNVEQPQSFRKCQKAYGANNAFLNTLDDYVASSYSNCHSAAKASPSPIACYVLANWWMLIALFRNHQYSVLSDSEITALTLLPNTLGGFPIIFLHNFYQRAESDLLSSFVEIYEKSLRCDPEVGHVLTLCWNQKVLSAQENIELICMDPYALPLYKPPQAQSVLRKHLRTTIQNITENRLVKDLFQARRSELHETVVECLTSMNVYNPKVMSMIFSCTPEGIIMELVTKFESGKSVMDAIILKKNFKKGKKVLLEALRADSHLHDFRLKLIKGRIAGSECIYTQGPQCSAEKTQNMRCSLWCRPVEAITQPTVCHTVKIGDLDWFITDRRADNTHFEVKWDPKISSKEGTVFSEGLYDAFLGDSTSKGLTHPEVKIMTDNIFALKIARLLDIYRWCVPTEEGEPGLMSISSLCAMMIKRYTRRDITDLLPFTAERPFGRTMQHHLRANQFRPSIIPNTLQNVYTWAQVNMLTHIELSGNPGHFKLNYNEIKCWVVSVLASRTWVGMTTTPKGRYWAVTNDCEYCLTPIREQSLWCRQLTLPSIDLYEHFDEARDTVRQINEDIQDFTPELYLIADQHDVNVTPRMAAEAVCQHVCDVEWENQKTLEDTVTGHSISARGADMLRDWVGGGSNKIVSFEDLRHVDVGIIFESLLPLVVGTISERFPRANTHNIGTILSSIPADMLPWTSVLKSLHHLHRVRELQDHMSRLLAERGGALIVDNYLTYAPKFGAQCYRFWDRHPLEHLRLTVMTNKVDEAVRRILKTRLRVYRKAIFHNVYKLYNDNRPDEQTRERRALEFVMAACRLYAFNDEYELSRGVHNEIIETRLTVINTEPDMEYDELVNVIEEAHPNYFANLNERYGALPISRVVEGLSMADPVMLDLTIVLEPAVLAKFTGNPIVISRIDVLTCRAKIKEFEVQAGAVRRNLIPMDQAIWEGGTKIRGDILTVRAFGLNHLRNDLNVNLKAEFDEMKDTVLESNRVTGDSWANRPLGAFNISMTRYAYLFNQMRLDTLGERRFVVCFADGYGGATRVISKIMRNSQILFVTSPTTSGETPIPYGVEQEGGNNKLILSSITTGRWDLRLKSNYIAMEQDHVYHAHLCVCDAEVPMSKDPKSTYDSIWKNVTKYWIRNSAPGGLLIMKVYLQYYETILQVLAQIRPRSKSCSFVVSKGSAWNNEVFLVATHDAAIPVDYDDRFDKYPPDIRCRSFRNFWNTYLGLFRNESLAVDRAQLNIRFPLLIERLCRCLPSYGWSQLEMIVKTGFEVFRLRIRNNESEDDYLARMLQNVNTFLTTLDMELLDGRRLDIGRLAVLYDTRTHKLELVYKAILLRGFRYVIRRHIAHARVITGDEIRLDFSENFSEYRAIHNTLASDPQAYWAEPVLIHDQYNMKSAWLQGVRWGMAAIPWGRVRAIQRENE